MPAHRDPPRPLTPNPPPPLFFTPKTQKGRYRVHGFCFSKIARVGGLAGRTRRPPLAQGVFPNPKPGIGDSGRSHEEYAIGRCHVTASESATLCDCCGNCRDPCARAKLSGRWQAGGHGRKRLRPRFFRHVAASRLSLVRAARIGPWSDNQSVPLGRTNDRRSRRFAGVASDQDGHQRLRPAGRGLQESDPAAMGGGDRQEVRRTVACRHHLPPIPRTSAGPTRCPSPSNGPRFWCCRERT